MYSVTNFGYYFTAKLRSVFSNISKEFILKLATLIYKDEDD